MSNDVAPRGFGKEFVLAAAIIAAVLLISFYPGFRSGYAHFANDAPLGAQMAEAVQPATGLFGVWHDLVWLGQGSGGMPVNITTALRWMLGPVGFLKFLQPACLLVLGVCAWFFFRQIRVPPAGAILGAIAAALNMNMLSNACWGLASRPLSVGLCFVAAGVLVSPSIRFTWQKAVLAGIAIGGAVMDGYDVGAILSIYLGLFAAFVWLVGKTIDVKAVTKTGALLVLMVFCAGVFAYQGLISLIGAGITGVVGADKKAAVTVEEQQRQFDWATQWSLSKAESLRVIIPGLFGYRLNSSADGNVGADYWGRVGQQPGWEVHKTGFPRHSGSGEYAGVLVVLIALWAASRAVARKQTVFSTGDRRMILFWAIAGVISLLLSWGRFAPFYGIIYQLPYFSTIRNPMKFMHAFHLALLVLFGYGLKGLIQHYLARGDGGGSLTESLLRWWGKLAGFDRKWAYGCLAAFGLSVLGWMAYSSAKPALIKHLLDSQFSEQQAQAIAKFSNGEVTLYLLLLAIALAWLFSVLSGAFAGPRAKWALLAAGLILTLDLTRANAYWVVFFNYGEKYATNPLIEKLREKPHEQRVAILNLGGQPQYDMFRQFYQVEWTQHHYMYYGIQSLDIVQMPRMSVDYKEYLQSVAYQPARYWQLSNTRWLFGPAGQGQFINQTFDAGKNRFNESMRFTLVQDGKGMINAETNTAGPFALYSFEGALPRVKLFSNWESGVADTNTLARLTNAAFDPFTTVFVAEPSAGAPKDEDKSKNPGKVEITKYSPKHLTMKASATVPSVLLLNDRHEPNWKVSIDGKPAELLRCNYIMRGVAVPPGEHTVEFRFLPSVKPLYVSCAAILAAIVLVLGVFINNRRQPLAGATQSPSPVPTK